MGTPKGEGRSRGGRSRGSERRRDRASRMVQSPKGGAQPGSVAGGLAVEEARVIEVQGAAQRGRMAGESEVAVSKSAEIAERVLETIPQSTLPGAEFHGAGSANSNYRADIVNVPPAAEPSDGDEPARASRASSRAHTERLEAASVLDAPASLHESVRPPVKASWAMRLWVAAMLSIIGSAGFVAWREHSAQTASGPSAVQSASEAAQEGGSQTREPPPTREAAGGAAPPAKAAAAVAPGPNDTPPSLAPPDAAEAATAAPAEAVPTPEQRASEDQARARRAARRAAGAAASAAAASEAAKGQANADGESAGSPSSPSAVDPGAEAPAELQLPRNPYDGDEVAGEAP